MGDSAAISMCLCGDVMIGRGIDQILPHPSNPIIYEAFMRSARRYVQIAEEATGSIPKPVDFAYIWGDALQELRLRSPDVKIINLETAVTTNDDYWRGKGINYRMHPDNVPCLNAASIDCCSLANNHVLDWGYEGMAETIATLRAAGIKTAGAGKDLAEAEAPAIMEVEGRGRVIVFSAGLESSGIPPEWAAASDRPGVCLLEDLAPSTARIIGARVQAVKRPRDIVVFSIHWGSNWGYEIPLEHIRFAHALINEASVDVIHGHSSHHVKGIEVYRGRPIMYGCGDFLNDYEGITGHETYRGDLGLMYFATVDPATDKLTEFRMTPTRIRHFRVGRASKTDTLWLGDVLNREGSALGTAVDLNPDDTFTLRFDPAIGPEGG